jgi:N-acetylglucosaminyl-diphospho-decaprenol L-rhamnosyltransferase
VNCSSASATAWWFSLSAVDHAGGGTVYCVVPVYNRLTTTREFVRQWQAQDYRSWRLLIVDDGSTDGTGPWLSSLADVRIEIISSTGNLWWGGAMTLGMRRVFTRASDGDYLLMLNDDVQISAGYLRELVAESQRNSGAVVGSTQRFKGSGKQFAAAYQIDYWRLRFIPVDPSADHAEIHAMPARGVLFPAAIARSAGVIHRLLPHHLGDLEYTARVREKGARLVVSGCAEIFTAEIPSSKSNSGSRTIRRWAGARSADNIWQRMAFFHSRGPKLLRWFAAPRYLIVALARLTGLRREQA